MKSESVVTNILLIVLIIMLSVLIYMRYKDNVSIDVKIENAVKKIEIKQPKNGINGKNGTTPTKGIDYFDGSNGKDGKDSVSTNTIVTNTETVVKEIPLKGEPGLTPLLRCDKHFNAWMVKYKQEDEWDFLNSEVVPCRGLE